MGIKDFFIKKMVESKLKDVPKAEQEKMLQLVQKNPELFQKIALEVQVAMKGGKNEMTAAMEVMSRYKKDLENIMK